MSCIHRFSCCRHHPKVDAIHSCTSFLPSSFVAFGYRFRSFSTTAGKETKETTRMTMTTMTTMTTITARTRSTRRYAPKTSRRACALAWRTVRTPPPPPAAWATRSLKSRGLCVRVCVFLWCWCFRRLDGHRPRLPTHQSKDVSLRDANNTPRSCVWCACACVSVCVSVCFCVSEHVDRLANAKAKGPSVSFSGGRQREGESWRSGRADSPSAGLLQTKLCR